jgi:broad specificity phosphatase PhoE
MRGFMSTRMIFIRHGDTGHRWGVFVGSTDAGLAEGALEKARKLGERLKPEGVRAIYTSQMQRAWKTAEAIGEVLGIRPVRLRELNEVDFGEWEMRWKGDVEKKSPGVLEERRGNIWDYAEHGGESYGQGRERAMPAIMDLFRRHEGETFAVVAHGSLMKIVYSALTGTDMEGIVRKRLEPLSAMFFKRDGDKIEVERSWGVRDG